MLVVIVLASVTRQAPLRRRYRSLWWRYCLETSSSSWRRIGVVGEQGYRCNRPTGGRGYKIVTQARGDETALREEGGCEGITAIAGEQEGLKQNGIETWP